MGPLGAPPGPRFWFQLGMQRVCLSLVCVAFALALYGCGEAECLNDTGGGCKLFGCSASRGDTDCTDGKCVCKEGSCAKDGACVGGEEKTDEDKSDSDSDKSDSDSDSDDDEIMQ